MSMAEMKSLFCVLSEEKVKVKAIKINVFGEKRFKEQILAARLHFLFLLPPL
jgi:hypothetical protein